MYESRAERPLPRVRFLVRMLAHFAGASALIGGSLGIGMAGYAHFERLSWLDAFVNAAMLLGGMGPIHNPQTVGGKLFAGCYALYCGLVVVVSVGILFAPLVHRAIHLFHWREGHVQ
jgi:hypothetical protein